MKENIAELLATVVQNLKQAGTLPSDAQPRIQVDHTKDKQHGDFATNIAMMLAKPAGMPPRKLAEQVVEQLQQLNSPVIDNIEIAGPGFINFFVSQASQFEVLKQIRTENHEFGRSNVGQGQRYQVEFVSANPTGPLHVGHGRGAAYGATVADLLEAVGYEVQREYYVNDAGRQMNILAASVWLRYLQLFDAGKDLPFPANGYKGDYVFDIAKDLKSRTGEALVRSNEQLLCDLPKDESEGGDKEIYIDAVIQKAKALLGDDYDQVFNIGLESIVDDIRDDLQGFGVIYQNWFSEKSLTADIESALQKLQDNGHLYEKGGALWFRSTDFGDDKDRVVRRDNGETTYFASDIAYHLNKFQRGFDKVINIWGADHHGYIPRVKAALQALKVDPDKLDVRLVQFAILYRSGERVQMSTRSGSFVTLRELREEVGDDAARFFYVTRKAEQHMDFDLDLAKSESKDNPVYYIQYAHARICSMMQKLEEQGWDWDADTGMAYLAQQAGESEVDLTQLLARYPERLTQAATQLEPHILTHYLRDLAAEFHTYYNSNKVLVDEAGLRNARVCICMGVQQVLKNGLELLGVSAPESM